MAKMANKKHRNIWGAKKTLPLKTKLRKNDQVMVIAGLYKGVTGKIIDFSHKKNRVIVQGVEPLIKHDKPQQDRPQEKTGIKQIPRSLHISNVAFLAEKTAKKVTVSKLGFQSENNKKIRIIKKTKKVIS